ncbi:MAG: DsbA family protein [Gammaproteobacteria bacterium]|nr:DsbA family protein [Gammaproteobacteria bacterium]
MNKFALVLMVLSIAATAFITHEITQSNSGGLSDQYVKKEDLKVYFDEYVNQSPNELYISVIKGLEQQKKLEDEKKKLVVIEHKQELENDPKTPYLGNEEGDIKIVMFSDYRCGFCKRMAPIFTKMLKKDTGLKLIMKEYPVLGQASVIAAKAALAVFQMDKTKYAAFNLLLFQKPLGSEKEFLEIAKAAGIDGAALLTEMMKPEYAQQIQKNRALGQKLGINGTPAFVIDDVLYPGAMSEEQILDVIIKIRDKRSARK